MLNKSICESCEEYWPWAGGKTWNCLHVLKLKRKDGLVAMLGLVDKEYNTEDSPIPDYCVKKFEQMISTAKGEADEAKA